MPNTPFLCLKSAAKHGDILRVNPSAIACYRPILPEKLADYPNCKAVIYFIGDALTLQVADSCEDIDAKLQALQESAPSVSQSAMEPNAQLGDIVFYVLDQDDIDEIDGNEGIAPYSRPAMITKVNEDGSVNLNVILDLGDSRDALMFLERPGITQGYSAQEAGTWHGLGKARIDR